MAFPMLHRIAFPVVSEWCQSTQISRCWSFSKPVIGDGLYAAATGHGECKHRTGFRMHTLPHARSAVIHRGVGTSLSIPALRALRSSGCRFAAARCEPVP